MRTDYGDGVEFRRVPDLLQKVQPVQRRGGTVLQDSKKSTPLTTEQGERPGF